MLFRSVFQPPRCLGGAFGLQHRGIAAFVEQDAREFGMGQCARHVAPARKAGEKARQRASRLRGQLVGVEDQRRRRRQRRAFRAGEAVDLLDRLVAKAALGHIDDPLERKVVGGLRDQPEIGERIADFRALVKTEAADDAIGQADLDEAVRTLRSG